MMTTNFRRITHRKLLCFSKNHKCLKWTDYQLTRFELTETDETCHGNWIEIQKLHTRIGILEAALREAGIDIPNDFL